MDAQSIINMLIAACGVLIGWVLKSIRESIRDLQTAHKDLSNTDTILADKVQRIEILVAGTYVKRDDMDKLGNALFAKLDKIEAKLDGKADK